MQILLFIPIICLYKLVFIFSVVEASNQLSLVNINFFLFFIKVFIISGSLLAAYLFFISSTRVSRLIGLVIFLLLPLLVIFFCFFKNIFFFLFMYEFFLFPSIFIVYNYSPNLRFLATNIYFIMWTQVGSVLIILVTVFLFLKCGTLYFYDLQKPLSFTTSLCLLIGFGVKIPMWPFHFWLTKTHVEAPTFFSIYLSGFLVKTAILGFIIFLNTLNPFSVLFAVFICLLGVIDSTFKLICQVDLKKLVAYTTVQEMNMILLVLFIGHTTYLPLVGLFILTHTLLSTLFFFIVDVIYKRFNSRTTNSVYGLLHLNFFLGVLLLISVFLYLGFPFTIKFFIEVRLFVMLFSFNQLIFMIIIFIVNWLGSIFFMKIWLNVIFLTPSKSLFFLNRKKDVVFFITHFSLFFFLLSIINYL